jgi:hypothetical protein
MTWLKRIGAAVCIVLGLIWIGQGVGLLPGSFMTGQAMWAIIGALLALGGGWLVWTAARAPEVK